MSEKKYANRSEPGRLDLDGIEWWACDPYPTWYRMQNNRLILRGRWSADWAPEEKIDE